MNHYFFDFPVYHSPSSDISADHLTGLNEKKLLVVVNQPDFSAENKQFLAKILQAVQYDIDQDAHVLTLPNNQKFAVNQLMNGDTYERCLIFGTTAKNIGYSVETFLYQPFEMGKKSYLFGHPLENVKDSTNYKKALWSALQQIFPLD